ncbi:flavin-containing monooxygenase 5 isoform X2 [Amia ocellicauda]|uniref:flavin-containing monooxygenase 5 isoform X2 n=1 Tax=Amia ocellicauda TaxID=2972642 RepID=UPI003463C93B
MVRRVAVVGAGLSGLACVKCCLDEGLEPLCFESSEDIGGLWRFKENPEPGRANMYRSLITNTSKEMMCFSDFPIPAHFPNYMHHSLIMDYFRMYAEHFQLLPHIRFQTCVRSVEQRPDFSRSGQWEVVTVDREGREETHIFDAVMVCTGLNTEPVLPLNEFPGIESFGGRFFHSVEYKDPEEFRGKRILVIGIGNSGGDIAVELSRVAEQTFLSTRHGAWIVSRLSSRGLPLDLKVNTRYMSLLTQWLPMALLNWVGERVLNHRLFSRTPMLNDDLPGRILSGAVVVRPDVREFRSSGVEFEDGTGEDQIDVVVFATGYNYGFPFLPTSVSPQPRQHLRLYKNVFPADLEQPTLAMVGLVKAAGPVMPIVEMQGRWATRVMKGLNKLPTTAAMVMEIECQRKRMERRFTPEHHALQVDYMPYMDELAEQFGVRPSVLALLLRDPRLGLSVMLGPCTPYQYRLRGPGKWAGARHAILTQWERVAQPMRTRPVPDLPRPSGLPLLLHVSVAGLLLCAAVLYTRQHPPAFLQDPPACLQQPLTFLQSLWLRFAPQ